MEFVIGGLAATSAGFFTNPLEVVKHHMELSKKSQEIKRKSQEINNSERRYKNFFDAGYKMAKKDGLRSLQKGLSPALAAHLVSYGTKLGTYQFGYNRGFTTDSNGNVVVPKSILTSGAGGIFGQYMSNPFYLLKIQHEIEVSLAKSKGEEPKGYLNTMKKIYKENGVRGFFRGATASMPRAFIGTSQLTTFAWAKESLRQFESFREHQMVTAILAASCAGAVLTMCMTPFDMVLTKLYKQAISPTPKEGITYQGFIDCARKVYQSNGLKPFYRGIGPLYLKLGPHTVLCLCFWEEFKELYDAATVDVNNHSTTHFYQKFGFGDNSYGKYGSFTPTYYDIEDELALDYVEKLHSQINWN